MNRALGSMIGMPEGKPLAVFQGESDAFNAGLFAGRLLARNSPELKEAYLRYKERLKENVLEAKAAREAAEKHEFGG